MKTQTLKSHLAILVSLLAINSQLSSVLAQGTAFTYQGRLIVGGNTSPNGLYDFQFQVFDAASGGNSYGTPNPNTISGATVSDGLFTVVLDFGTSVFTGPRRWLEIRVRTSGAGSYTVLAPRQELMPTPYAITAENAATLGGLGAGNFWNVVGNGGTTPGANFVGTTDNRALEMHVNNQRALRLEPDNTTGSSPNVIGGSPNNSVSSAIGATIGGGGAPGAINSVTASWGTVSGGQGNTTAGGVGNTVGGGYNNTANGTQATVAGGFGNGANSKGSAVGGGANNSATWVYATVSGGYQNTASGYGAFVGGGGYDNSGNPGGNQAGGSASVVSGGFANSAVGNYASVSGGQSNSASGICAFVGGGGYDGSTFAGNLASGNGSVVKAVGSAIAQPTSTPLSAAVSRTPPLPEVPP
jgi:hypothetical protein